ncbi:hypothetical protein N9834_00275 [Akkermansiaceae bacterium]|nr:hypothetical protein [Akkermansiaceae bacterium]MDB4288492.1 hypothetical protein [bacterium]MDA8960068.1 hypothetical protein [Akkermansiaceae bacterium]MDB4261825.1 hypothetical protein [Akkermansiaceae bacterium]MDB4327846.1 hypothetical protein [Akkermansiaceae bacterium]
MKRSLITFTLLSSLLPAQVTEKKEDSAMSRLPVGATLTNVSVPRFDDKKRRTSLLTAKTMSVESEEELKGKGLTIYLFDKEQKVSSTAKMAAATYLVNKEQLAATGELLLRATNDEFLARGQSGLLALSSRQGILLGRAETMFLQKEKKPKKTAMTLPTSIAPLLAGLQMLTAAPPLVTTEELVEFEKQVAPRVIPNIDPRADVEQAEENEANLTQRLANFLSLVGQSRVLAQAAAPVAPEVPFEDLFKPNKKRIIIKADGFYFDGENSEFSYLGNTTLTGRGITMTSKEGMKVLFDPPKEKQVAKKDEADLLGGFKGIGEMKQFTATGGIEINGKDKDGQPIRVRGSRAVYDAKAQKIILRGSNLSFLVQNVAVRSSNKDAYIVVSLLGGENVSVQTNGGGWQFSAPDRKKKK